MSVKGIFQCFKGNGMKKTNIHPFLKEMGSIPLKITKIQGKLEKIAIFRGIDFISPKKEMKSIPLKRK